MRVFRIPSEHAYRTGPPRNCREFPGEGQLLTFVEIDSTSVDGHAFGVYDCGDDNDALVQELASMVRDLYLDEVVLKAALRDAASGLDTVVNPAFVGNLIAQIRTAAIPEPASSTSKPAHLDLARNEIAEVIALAAVDRLLDARVPAPRIRHKEVRDQPSRGLDLLALQLEPELSLVVSEVKASSSESSPPQVVDSGDDCLRQQLIGLVANRRRLREELNWCFKHCTDEELKLRVAEAMVKLGLKQLPIVAFPVLVRPSSVFRDTDFGQLFEHPDQLDPARLHFCIAQIHESLEDLASAVYNCARGQP